MIPGSQRMAVPTNNPLSPSMRSLRGRAVFIGNPEMVIQKNLAGCSGYSARVRSWKSQWQAGDFAKMAIGVIWLAATRSPRSGARMFRFSALRSEGFASRLTIGKLKSYDILCRNKEILNDDAGWKMGQQPCRANSGNLREGARPPRRRGGGSDSRCGRLAVAHAKVPVHHRRIARAGQTGEHPWRDGLAPSCRPRSVVSIPLTFPMPAI